MAEKDKLPDKFAGLYGNRPEQFFITVTELKEQFGEDVKKLPWGAIGLYTYFIDRIGVGLKQLMACARKWNFSLLDRGDIAALTERASRVTGIPMIDEIEQNAMEEILG